MIKKLIFFLLLICAAGAYFFYEPATKDSTQKAQHSQKEQQNTVKVITEPIRFTENSRLFETIGTGRAELSADIYPAVEDEVISINFEAQQKVEKGNVLVELDDREEKLNVRLREVELKDTQALLKRYEEAVKEGAVPQSQVDTAKAEYDAAKVALDQAKLNLEYHQIKAPFTGYVGIPSIDIGDRIGPQTLITGLDQRDVIYVDFEVPETLIGQLQEALKNKQKITLGTPSYADQKFIGTIHAIESRVNQERRTITARVKIQNQNDALRPGMSFSTKWSIPGEKYATVPEISLQWQKDGSFIWLIRENKAQKITARVIARKAGNVLVSGEISETDQVVVEGLQRLREGSIVEILGKENETTTN